MPLTMQLTQTQKMALAIIGLIVFIAVLTNNNASISDFIIPMGCGIAWYFLVMKNTVKLTD